MPAPLDVMKELEIHRTIQFWATATESAKNIARSFFRAPEAQNA